MKILSFLVLFILLFCSCTKQAHMPEQVAIDTAQDTAAWEKEPLEETQRQPGISAAQKEDEKQELSAWQSGRTDADNYIDSLAFTLAERLTAGASADEERIRMIYRYLIETIYFADPVGTDIWRYRCDPDSPPDYVHAHALSPLVYKIGSCEDFAAVLTLLLQQAGYRAMYVSGLTISDHGEFVDHAWTVVQIDGKWYHIDSQLEQNIVRNGTLSYHYFLKDDQYMLADHRWGENLISYWGQSLTPQQQELIRRTMTPPECIDATFPAPEPEPVTLPMKPDSNAVFGAIRQEKEAYETKNGPIAPLTWDMTPPIFAVMPKG